MKTQTEISAELGRYLALFPQEQRWLSPFADFVARYGGNDLYDRKNPEGHITASAFVVDISHDKLLVVHHNHLKKWIQPGGHVDRSDSSVLAAALRELKEETGLGADDVRLLVSERVTVADFDSHQIPANPAKDEGRHFHHDIRYLFEVIDEDARLLSDPAESGGIRWADFDEFPADEGFWRIAEKLRKGLYK